MAKGRKYARDARGRFASVGATARGGRLARAGGKRATVTSRIKGGTPAGAVRRQRGDAPAAPTSKPVAVRTSKAPRNPAKDRYKSAAGSARMAAQDLRGTGAEGRRRLNSASAVVRNMERNRSTAKPTAANSPRAKQQQRQAGRVARAASINREAWKREADGPNSKASRSAAVSKRALQIYRGKVDPKVRNTKSLTATRDPEKLIRRRKKAR